MRINGIKFFLALAVAFLLGFVCEILAPETENRNWISLAAGFVSIAGAILPAMGIAYADSHRGANIKVFSWIWTVVISVSNIVFSCFEYKIDIYIVVVLFLAVVGWSIIYGLYSAKPTDKKSL